jgi:type IX secretion system PorP/SprF family membrane protein
MYNPASINPAYAGSRGMLSFSLIYRTQWVGLEGGPKTAQFSMNTPIGEKGVGLGFSFYNDQIGPVTENNLVVDYSYTIQVGQNNTLLSFGLKGGFQLLDIDFNKLTILDSNDTAFQRNINNRFQPIVGFGTFLHTDKWYLGLSTPNLLETDYDNDATVSTASERMHVFLTGGYVFELNPSWDFKPAFLARSVSGSSLGLDVSANFWYNKKVSFGAAYRLDAAVSALIGLQATDQLMIGYAFDKDTTDLERYNNGSHEIFLRWELFTRMRSKVSPRFF